MRALCLSVDGFRSLRHIENWQPGVLNVLIGPNGTGKSNLLRFGTCSGISSGALRPLCSG